MTRRPRFDHVGIPVDDLDAVTAFFMTLGLDREGGPMTVEGDWLDTVIGLPDSRVDVVMLQPSGGGTKLELSRFERPAGQRGTDGPPANELGLRNIAFEVDDIRATVDRMNGTATTWSATSGTSRTSTCWPTCAAPKGSPLSLAQHIG